MECLRCGAEVFEFVTDSNRCHCGVCGLKLFRQDWRVMAYVDKSRENLWIEVPLGCLAVFSWEAV